MPIYNKVEIGRIAQQYGIAKEYKPELLFEDETIVERLKEHPMAIWKCK